MSWTDDDWSEAVDKAVARADKAEQQLGKVQAEIKALRAQLQAEIATLRAALPASYYAGLALPERVAMMVSHWQRAIEVNKELEKQLQAEQGRVKMLTLALEPFAKMGAGKTFESIPADHITLVDGGKKLFAGDFKRAAWIVAQADAESADK